jgi:small-conductance mechanosensitive channel
MAWFAIRALGVGRAWLAARVREAGKDEMESRGLRTQLILLERVVSVVIVVFALAVALIRFDFVRSVGLSLLASAGVAGIILGFAAQKSLSGIIAGIQISVTQPVRIGDTVVIEGENGAIEEINLTYIVVRVWDGRRLVVPIAKFLDTTFQNWTKVSPELVGTVTIQADFTTPVDRVRKELDEIVRDHPKWDGRTCTLEVTESLASTLTLRALVSSADASKNWDLRCEVREKLIAFLRDHEGGAYLPRAREQSITP